MSEIGTIGPYDSMNLPYSPEAEQAVLGALVMEPSCLDSIIEIIPNPDYFYIQTHKVIYGKMTDRSVEDRFQLGDGRKLGSRVKKHFPIKA